MLDRFRAFAEAGFRYLVAAEDGDGKVLGQPLHRSLVRARSTSGVGGRGKHQRLARHEAKRTIDRAQHPVKFMSASNDQPACGNHAVDALPQG